MSDLELTSHHRGLRWIAAALSLLLMLAMLGTPPVQRTQEARVLETAREMLGEGWRGWLIPHLNGQVRLEKPPLAYWLAAAAYKIGGVSEGIGRIPFALAGWATLLITYATGRRIAGERGGLLAGAILLGSLLFARHARLAETDILATLFVTAAIFCIWRAEDDDAQPLPLSSANWFRLSGVMTGLAVMGKGLPAVFVIVFLLLRAAMRRDWRLLWRWARSGAILLAALVAAPWFIYAGTTFGWGKFHDEVMIGIQGMEHTGSVFQYVPDLMRAALPWSALALAAIVIAARRWRDETHARLVLTWFAACFIPLLIGGQRQPHYLFPAMPPLAVMTAWLIETSDRDASLAKLTRILLLGVRPPLALAIVVAVLMTVVSQLLIPAMPPRNPRTISAQIKALGPGPYCFYGDNISLTLLFYLGQPMPRARTPAELTAAIERSPSMIVIAQTKAGKSPPPVPDGLRRVAEIPSEDQTFEIYRVRR